VKEDSVLGIRWWALWISQEAVKKGAQPFILYRYYEFDEKQKKYVFEEKDSTHFLIMSAKELTTNNMFKPFLIEHDRIMTFLKEAKKKGVKNAFD